MHGVYIICTKLNVQKMHVRHLLVYHNICVLPVIKGYFHKNFLEIVFCKICDILEKVRYYFPRPKQTLSVLHYYISREPNKIIQSCVIMNNMNIIPTYTLVHT